MSSEVVEYVVRNMDVDVDESMKENVSQSEISGDSGAETLDSASATYLPSSDSEVSPTKHTESSDFCDQSTSVDAALEIDNSPSKSISESLSSKNCGSPLPSDDLPTETLTAQVITDRNNANLVTNNTLKEQNETGIFELENKITADTDVNSCGTLSAKHNPPVEKEEIRPISPESELKLSTTQVDQTLENSNVRLDTDTTNNIEKQKKSNLEPEKDISQPLDIDKCSDSPVSVKPEFPINIRTLTTSTCSLNDQVHTNSINGTKSPYSRSAENISTMEENTQSSSNSSTKDLNADQILSQFTEQKNKVKATQKIVNEPTQPLDARYARIPKEILSQDLGSIAKSVTGIFSSVSGSLKNAYNNSHRVSTPKLPIKIVKPINGKVMNDIFEDSVPETANVTPNVNTEAINKEITQEKATPNEEVSQDPVDESKDLLKLQIESLERVLTDQRRDNAALRDRVKQQMDELQAKDHTFKELEAKVDMLCKRAEQAQREKDAAVMRYASVECAGIEARRAADAARAAERAATAERDLLANKLRSARDERERICQLYDDKCHELKTSELEASKVREELRELDGRLKWTQSKLRIEMDAYKESAERVEKLSQQVTELESAKETAAVNASDSAKAKQFEAELKESQAALILCRHEKEELERRLQHTTQLLDTCRKERDEALEGLARTTAQVEQLKESNLRLEEEAAELAALRAQAALADTLSSQLQRETERASQAEEALSRERARAETCARREAGALEHAARLTAQHVAQRAGAAEQDAKVQALATDNTCLRERVTTLEAECSSLKTALTEEAERRNKENRVLARKVAELTEEAAEANKKLEWEKGENGVLKKKHASAIKEMNRELQRSLKRVEQLEAKLPQRSSDGPSTRTGSTTSLSSGESAHDERLQNGHADAVPDVQSGPVPERQALIERIVSLQRAAARRAERCEFLEEHARHLTEELRGKAKLLRQLLPALPAGALASTHSDANKKEIARLGGGAMAALWGGEADGMTLELALEVARRLQAVLEDTLLKNITLKENMDTLGEEIARLRKQVGESK